MTMFAEIDPEARVDQGDVFADIYFSAIDAYVNAVVITPTCDFKQEKAHLIKFISTVPLDMVIRIIADSIGITESAFQSTVTISKSQCSSLVKALYRNTTGDFLPRYYLLPECQGKLPALYLDFQRIFVIPFRQVVEEYLSNRVASIVSPWRERIVAQYSGYSMRVGVPSYSDDELRDMLSAAGLRIPS
jgi:hypothetical protein